MVNEDYGAQEEFAANLPMDLQGHTYLERRSI